MHPCGLSLIVGLWDQEQHSHDRRIVIKAQGKLDRARGQTASMCVAECNLPLV